jgi:hypothetical protein
MIALAFALLLSDSVNPAAKEIARPATLWASSEELRLCLVALERETEARRERLKATGASRELRTQIVNRLVNDRVAICERGSVLKLTEGMAVEMSSNPAVCAAEDTHEALKGLLRVRVTKGKDVGATGCVFPADLREPVPF